MGETTTQLTGARLGDLLLKVFKPLIDVPTEISQLESQYKIHNEALTAMESLDIELHSVIRCFLLQQMTSKLAAKQELLHVKLQQAFHLIESTCFHVIIAHDGQLPNVC